MPKTVPAPPEVYLGADPGVSGGIAWLNADGTPGAVKTPPTEKGLWDLVRRFGTSDIRLMTDRGCPRPTAFAVLEKVGGYIAGDESDKKYGERRQRGHTMFKFGMSYGALRIAFVAAGFVPGETLTEVTPAVWQRALGIEPKGRGGDRHEHKTKLKALAETLFPSVKVTLATADSLLIAEYCRRLRTGRL